MNPEENPPPGERPPPRRAPRGRALFAPLRGLLFEFGRVLLFLPVFASGVLALWIGRKPDLTPAQLLQYTVLATALHTGLALLYFLRAKHVLRWFGLAELMVVLGFASVVAFKFLTSGRVVL